MCLFLTDLLPLLCFADILILRKSYKNMMKLSFTIAVVHLQKAWLQETVSE